MPSANKRAGSRRKIGNASKSLNRNGGFGCRVGLQSRTDNPVLHGELNLLRHARRERAALLYRLQIVIRYLTRFQRRGQAVGRRHRILHGDIDADAADRRHRVGCIADADQPRPPPLP